jgi:hypothetical protein
MFRFLFILAFAGSTAFAQSDPPDFSPAAEINSVLPSWLTFGGQYRARFEGYTGGNFKPESTDDYVLSQLRLNLLIHPTSWLKLYVEGMDARSFAKSPALPPYQNTWDIRQAYVELGDTEKEPAALRVGRQELKYGDQRLVGNADWTNTGHLFDAVRGTLHYQGYRLDIFAASIVNPVTGTWDHHQEGNNLDGLYGGLDKLIPNGTIEPYIFWRLQPRVKDEEGKIANVDEKVPGVRVAGTLPLGFNYGTEMVREFGSLGADKIEAWAGHWVVGRTATSVRWKPRVYAEYNYASGDKNPKDGIRGTFDTLYPSGHDLYGMADQVGWRNIEDFRTGAGIQATNTISMAVEYNNWFLASAKDALYAASGAAVVRSAAGTAGTHVGQELDISGKWQVRKPLLVGAGFGYIFPGEFLKKTTPGTPYTYPYVMAVWKF